MSLLTILAVILVVGILLWAVTTYIPMEPTVKRILVGVAVIGLVIFLLRAFGLLTALERVHVQLDVPNFFEWWPKTSS